MVKRMTADEFADALETLHWSAEGLGRILNVGDRTVRRWKSGDAPVPDVVGTWIRALAAFHDANPPPAAPERRPGPGKPLGGSLYPPA